MPPARSAFNVEFAQRVKRAREELGERRGATVTQMEMARLLSRAAGYTVSSDRYRKYEGARKPSMMPHDLLFHFAEITGKTTGTLLAPLDPGRASRAA